MQDPLPVVVLDMLCQPNVLSPDLGPGSLTLSTLALLTFSGAFPFPPPVSVYGHSGKVSIEEEPGEL